MKRLIGTFDEKKAIQKLYDMIKNVINENPNITIYEIEQNEDIYWQWHSIYGLEEIDERPDGNTLERIIQKISREFMKRLIKSKFFDSIKLTTIIEGYIKPGDYTCFINPTSGEFQEIIQGSNNGARIILMDNGDIYSWTGEICHMEAIELFDIPLTNNSYEIIFEENTINFQTYNIDSFKILQSLLKKNKNLFNLIPQNTPIMIEEDIEGTDILHNDMTIEEFLNGKI